MEFSTNEKLTNNLINDIQGANERLEQEVNRLLGDSLDQVADKLPDADNKEELKVDFSQIVQKFENFSQMETILRSGLIGEYQNGKYDIADGVKKDLLKLRKIVDDEQENIIKCHAFYGERNFDFVIEYDSLTTYCSSKIYLIEDRDDVDIVEKLKTLVGAEVFPGGTDVVESISKAWNLKKGTDEEGESQEIELTDLDAVLLGVKKDYAFSKELMEILSQIYILRMTALYGKLGEEGQKILNEYNKIVKGLAITRPSVLQSYSKLKNILDKVIKKHDGITMLKNSNEKAVSEILESYYKPLERINIKVSQKADDMVAVNIEPQKKTIEKVKKAEKKAKAAEKSKPSKKSGGKSSDVKGPTVKPWGSYKYEDTAGKIKIPIFTVLRPILPEVKLETPKKDKGAPEIKPVAPKPKMPEREINDDDIFNGLNAMGDKSSTQIMEGTPLTADKTITSEAPPINEGPIDLNTPPVDLGNMQPQVKQSGGMELK